MNFLCTTVYVVQRKAPLPIGKLPLPGLKQLQKLTQLEKREQIVDRGFYLRLRFNGF